MTRERLPFLPLFASALTATSFTLFAITIGFYDAVMWTVGICGFSGLVAFILFSALVIVMERDS